VDAVQSSSAAFSKIPAVPRLRRIKEPLRSAPYAHLIATPTQPPRYPVDKIKTAKRELKANSAYQHALFQIYKKYCLALMRLLF
jgi:hypothetical protein